MTALAAIEQKSHARVLEASQAVPAGDRMRR